MVFRVLDVINTKKLVRFGLAATSWLAATASGLGSSGSGSNADMKILHGHTAKLPPGLLAEGELPATNQLRLAIGLALRDGAGLIDFLAGLYDPTSPNYRQYLTPEEFTSRFGPTVDDYKKVIDFAASNGLTVTETHGNRLLLDVQGPVQAIERAFHIKMHAYRHPTEARDFFAPDAEPSVETQLAIADVSGLNNYVLPHPKSLRRATGGLTENPIPLGGSSPSGSYMGNDFRAAYLPGVTLTGTGQMVGLLQFDGFYASDISAYTTAAGLPNVPVQTVLLDGYDGVPTTGANSGNSEVSLDIEMVMSMAPGLAAIVVFEAGPSGNPNDILNRMAASNQVKQFSCSWGWGGGPTTTTDNILKQMATQGQSFFTASGDSDAFTSGANSSNGVDNPSNSDTPASNPYITTVGGTTLTTSGPGGVWVSETVWNWGAHGGGFAGSSGGISSYYSIPSWQTGISMSTNGGSTTQRNIPDVALTADNVCVLSGNGSHANLGGTSCAAPLWAGLTALVNEQATAAGKSAVGFLNPSLYTLGTAGNYTSSFHDITTGNNTSSSSPNLFYATTGYDLCTGWGTPAGQSLIDALSGAANALSLAPASGFAASGAVGGPFKPASQDLVLTNSGAAPLSWSIINNLPWLTASAMSGTLAGTSATSVSLGFSPAAAGLSEGIYTGSLIVTNNGSGAISFSVTLKVGQPLVQNGDFETGDFTGWTLVGNTTSGGTIYNAVESAFSRYSVAHSGTYGAFLGDTQVASLSQAISTVPGQYYLLSLWLDNPTSGSVQRFAVNWNTNASNNTIFSLLNPPAFSWTNLQFLVGASDSTTTLQIQAENDPSFFGLDDVRVAPISTAASGTLATSGDDVQLSWNTTSGVTYQIQYATDLSQPTWLNLTAPFVATNTTSTFQDANALKASAQRYYRLVVSP